MDSNYLQKYFIDEVKPALDRWSGVGGEGGAVSPTEYTTVTSAEEMENILAHAEAYDTGEIYYYTGETTEKYTNGSFYMIFERVETQTKTQSITENGTYTITPDDGNDGLSEVTVEVNVPVPEGYIVPEGSTTITANGTHNVNQYVSAEVNVPVPEGYIVPEGELVITENWTRHNVAKYSTVWTKLGVDYEIQQTGTEIAPYTYAGMNWLTGITIPNNITTIGKEAFYNTRLATIHIPASVTSIGLYAFSPGGYAVGLRKVYYDGTLDQWVQINQQGVLGYPLEPSNVELYIQNELLPEDVVLESATCINTGAFCNCKQIKSITIPSSVTRISSAFSGCINLKQVYYTGSLDEWCNLYFSNYQANPLYAGYYPRELYIDGELIQGVITLPVGRQNVPIAVFTKYDHITGINLPVGYTNINSYAFMACSNLASINGTDTIEYISVQAFSQTALVSINLPKIIEISGVAFGYCTKLSSITLGDTLLSIDRKAFYNCSLLTDIQYAGTKEQWKAIIFGTDWDTGTGDYIITCSDGTIAKDGTET